MATIYTYEILLEAIDRVTRERATHTVTERADGPVDAVQQCALNFAAAHDHLTLEKVLHIGPPAALIADVERVLESDVARLAVLVGTRKAKA